MSQICIDARLWGVTHTGIGRYIENLLDNLPAGSVSIIIPRNLAAEPKLKKFKQYYASFHPYSLLSQLEMLWVLIRARPDLLHVTHFTIPLLWPGKIIVTIHDLIKHQSRGTSTTTRSPFLYWPKYLGYLVLLRLSVLRASHIIVPAHYWKNDLISRFDLPTRRISVVYEGVDRDQFPFQPASHPQPYVIYVGNIYPHKNLPVLLRAIKILSDRINLVVVCSRSVFQSRLVDLVEKLDLSSRVEFKNNLSDQRLSHLLSSALAFVTPSLIEGFGLPGLEAMSAGTPVVSARSSCLPEIYGDAAVYFDPHSPAELAHLITELANHPQMRQQLIKLGRDQARLYSWEKMANQTWEIYQTVLP